MTLTKFAVGIHKQEVSNYLTGQLQTYLTYLGLGSDAGGAIAHLKLRDQTSLWAAGTPPTVAGQNALFLSEAKTLGFRTLVAYVADGSYLAFSPSGTAGQRANLATAALALAGTANIDILVYGNELQATVGAAWADSRTYWYDAEAACGAQFQAAGKLWAVGADQSRVNTLQYLSDRRAAWGATVPDFYNFHSYGTTGSPPRSVGDLMDTFNFLMGQVLNEKCIFAEWALDFEGLGAAGTKAWVRDYRAKEYAEHLAREFRRHRCYGVYFTLEEVLADIALVPPVGPALGLKNALLNAAQTTAPPARAPATAGTETYRVLTEGRYTNKRFNAAVLAALEYARSILLYPAYWG